MNASAFFAVFPRQLRFWTFHCIVNALLSFCIAWSMLDLKDSPTGIAAMLAGIGTFILFYATVTSIPGPLAHRGNLLARSLAAGTKVRSCLVGISLLLSFALGPSLMPDFFCGLLADDLVKNASYTVSSGYAMTSIGSSSSFLHVYTVTIVDGMVLSIILLTISFVSLLVLQGKERRKAFKRDYPQAIPR